MFLFRKKKTVNPLSLPKSPRPLRGWTNFGMFEVHGINPSSGRQNKRIIEALTVEDAISKARSVEKLLDPITAEEMQRPMATERQIAYGNSIGVCITEKETMVDASALISRANDGDPDDDYISETEWIVACKSGAVVSALCGHTLYRSVMEHINPGIVD